MDINFFLTFLTLVLGFYMAWNIGANDVANAMGTSVGSKALTLKKAVLLAAILEFSGAFFVGSNVSETIQKGLIHPEVFQAEPMLFVIGMIGSLLATGVLLQIASYFGLPISTTHAIIGAVIGFGLMAGGPEIIQWKKVALIASSWVISPLLSGAFSYGIFRWIQKKIFLSSKPLLSAKQRTPYLVFLSFNVVILSLCYNGFSSLSWHLSFPAALTLSLGVSLVPALISYVIVWKKGVTWMQPIYETGPTPLLSQKEEIENLFISLQIISACLVAFAHGGNDVANAIGPVAAVLSVINTNTIGLSSVIPPWLLAMGGVGIVIGLATWGWRVIETVGKKITELTPSRGFSAEFGAAVTILLASKLGFPISTTHALVGAVFGVGLVQGLKSLNLKMLKEIVISWVVTIPLCSLFSIFFFYLLKRLLLS